MSVADFSLCAEAQSLAADGASPVTAKAPALKVVVVALPAAAAV